MSSRSRGPCSFSGSVRSRLPGSRGTTPSPRKVGSTALRLLHENDEPMIADALRRVAGLRLTDEDGHEHTLTLQPPATEDEIRELETRLQCPLPGDIRDALRVSRGFADRQSESFSLLHHEALGLEDLIPHAYSIAYDGFGNYWVLDL